MLAGAILTTSVARGQCQYEVTLIRADPCPIHGIPPPTLGVSLNEQGHVVGWHHQCSVSRDEAFIWTPETGLVTLERPPGVLWAVAYDINDHGQIVGTIHAPGRGRDAFVYEDGEFLRLPPRSGGAWAIAAAINDAGLVVGQRSIGEGVNPMNAFVWSERDGFLDLGLMDRSQSHATSVNEAGVVVGQRGRAASDDEEAFMWESGTLALLGPIPGGFTSWANDINNRGQIVVAGFVQLATGDLGARSFLWEDGLMTDLGVLPGHPFIVVHAINDLGQTVGGVGSLGGEFRPFLWQHDQIHDLTDFIVPVHGITVGRARDVNSRGQILADAGGWTVLLMPIDRPAGDVDSDCRVGPGDLESVLRHWGTDDSPADVNDDGVVDMTDLLVVLGTWG